MAEVEPLPAEMLSPGLDAFVRALPVASVQVHDRSGVTEYGPPAENGPQDAAAAGAHVVTPPWAGSASGRHEAPVAGVSEPDAPVFQQPGEPIGQAEVAEDDHGVVIGMTFNQPFTPEPDEQAAEDEELEGRDLTVEERVEWLEGQVANLARRLQGIIDHHDLWDGS